MKTKIKPCPFCESSSLVVLQSSDECFYSVQCTKCFAVGPSIDVDATDEYDRMDGTEALYNKMLMNAARLAVKHWNDRPLGRAVEKNIKIEVDERW